MSRETGAVGEEFAAAYLVEQGYAIIARNFYAGHEEIDIIARKGTVVAFVEVKARTMHEVARYGRPARSVTLTKQRHLITAAESYLRRHPGCGTARMDVIEVYLPDGENPAAPQKIVHIPGAFMKRR